MSLERWQEGHVLERGNGGDVAGGYLKRCFWRYQK